MFSATYNMMGRLKGRVEKANPTAVNSGLVQFRLECLSLTTQNIEAGLLRNSDRQVDRSTSLRG
jgi:hypothetical protein